MRLGAGMLARGFRWWPVAQSTRRIGHSPPVFSKSADAPIRSIDRWRSMNAGTIVRCLVIAGLIIYCAASDIARPLDDVLSNLRYSALQRPPTGDVVFVDIDAASLKEVGVWPWPRTVHAEVVDRLMALGAAS